MNSEPPARPRRRFGKYFALGALFELLLLLSAAGFPGGNLAIEITNFAIIIHYPLAYASAGASQDGIVVFLVLGFLLWASLWGFLFLQIARLAGWGAAHLSRKQKLAFGCLAGLGGVALLGQAVVPALPQKSLPFETSPDLQAVVEGNNAFALDLYQKLRARPGNLSFSPFSISSALAMTSAGARGQTEAEMTNVLHFSRSPEMTPEKWHHLFHTLLTRLDRVQRWNRILLKCANSLWCQQDHRFAPAFLQLVRENYSADAKAVDFKNSPGAAAAEINRWVDARTSHTIPGGIEPGQIDSDTRMVLSDVIYFKGKWLKRFQPGDTRSAPFYISTNETITVPMMYQHGEFKQAISEDGSVEMLELPYSGSDLSMVILLPSKYNPDIVPNDVFALEPNLTSANLRAWLADLDRSTPHKTTVALPRFTTASRFNLVSDLKALGLTSAFDSAADFSGLDGTTNLFLSGVIHQSFVKVDEAGTEAAAATLVPVKTRSMSGSFYVDHPFIFLIRDNGSGSILFLGRIIDPAK